MFWAIQLHSPIKWKPCNLLSCFWTCFKLLISWVDKGECPNFFIPQNNMFRVKVVGHKQAVLFEKLHSLYNEGIICLLLSPTIGEYLEKSIPYRYLKPGTEETNCFRLPHRCVSVYGLKQVNRSVHSQRIGICTGNYCSRTITKDKINFNAGNNCTVFPSKGVEKLLLHVETKSCNIYK